MKRNPPIILTAVLVLAGCSTATSEPETAPSHTSPPSLHRPVAGNDYTGPSLTGLTSDDWKVTVVSDELNYPWEVRIADGTLVVTEASGTIAMIDADGGLERYDVQTSDPVVHDGGSGLMGLALAADFGDTGNAYVYYAYAAGSDLTNRIAEVNYDGTAWVETRVLLDDIPGHQLYNGERLAIGPDKNLHATTGWVHNDDHPQDVDNLAGKSSGGTWTAAQPRATPSRTPTSTLTATATPRDWPGTGKADSSRRSTVSPRRRVQPHRPRRQLRMAPRPGRHPTGRNVGRAHQLRHRNVGAVRYRLRR